LVRVCFLREGPITSRARARTKVKRPAAACVLSKPMTRSLRALASAIVGLMTVVGMMVYQHYSREPPSDAFALAVTTVVSILAWSVTGLE